MSIILDQEAKSKCDKLFRRCGEPSKMDKKPWDQVESKYETQQSLTLDRLEFYKEKEKLPIILKPKKNHKKLVAHLIEAMMPKALVFSCCIRRH